MLHAKTLSALALLALGAAPTMAANCYGSGLWAKQANARGFITTYCNTITQGSNCYNDGVNRWDIATCDASWMTPQACALRLTNIITVCNGNNLDTQGGTENVNGCVNKIDPNAGNCF